MYDTPQDRYTIMGKHRQQRQGRHRAAAGVLQHSLYESVPSGYRDHLTSKAIRSATLYGSTMSNSHLLKHYPKPHIENFAQGMGRVHINRLLHAQKNQHIISGRGIGPHNTKQLMFRSSKHRHMPKAGAGGYARAYNSSYKSKLAHDVIIDTNPAVSSSMMMRDPLKYAHAQEMSNCILRKGRKRMGVRNNAENAQAYVNVNPLYKYTTRWFANTASLM